MKMILKILRLKGIHYLATRYGGSSLRRLAFDQKYLSGDWVYHDENTEVIMTVQRYLQNGDLLLMGCGGAALLNGIDLTKLNSVLGVDISQKAIQLANRFASEKVSFKVADMLLFQPQDVYDIIMFPESFNYVPNQARKALLDRLQSHLKQNGVVIVTLAQADRYCNILKMIRTHYLCLEDRKLARGNRHLIVFR